MFRYAIEITERIHGKKRPKLETRIVAFRNSHADALELAADILDTCGFVRSRIVAREFTNDETGSVIESWGRFDAVNGADPVEAIKIIPRQWHAYYRAGYTKELGLI